MFALESETVMGTAVILR